VPKLVFIKMFGDAEWNRPKTHDFNFERKFIFAKNNKKYHTIVLDYFSLTANSSKTKSHSGE
jgi:hypothetical protein